MRRADKTTAKAKNVNAVKESKSSGDVQATENLKHQSHEGPNGGGVLLRRR